MNTQFITRKKFLTGQNWQVVQNTIFPFLIGQAVDKKEGASVAELQIVKKVNNKIKYNISINMYPCISYGVCNSTNVKFCGSPSKNCPSPHEKRTETS